MADVQPLRALHYDLAKVGSLADVAAPPYDVIDPEQRAPPGRRARPTTSCASTCPRAEPRPLRRGRRALRALAATRAPSCATTSPRSGRSRRTTPAPTGARSPATASSRACASRTTAPGASARTSARTRARKEDRLRLTRATKANLSPIFCLYADPSRRDRRSCSSAAEPFGELTDDGRHASTASGASPTPRRSRPSRRALDARRAAHRRRPPPLRDRARLRRGDRRRGRAPLRAHVPRRAAGRGPDRLPHPPPRPRHDAADPGGAGEHAARALRPSRRSTTPTCARPTATGR